MCLLTKLLELAGGKCRHGGCNEYVAINHTITGCCITIYGQCCNNHGFYWESSNVILNQMKSHIYEDNLLFCSALLLSGNHYTKLKTFFDFFGLPVPSRTTFHAYQRLYICPGVKIFYDQEQVINIKHT